MKENEMSEVKLVRVKMLRNSHGSPDGHSVKHYHKDEEYDLPAELARLFVDNDKCAERVEGKKAEATLENKADKAPKNKADKA